MKTPLVLLIALIGAATWKQAEEGWQYRFPRDHAAHPDFKTEWWYFTGHLQDERGGEYGFQLTFFRHGIQRELPENASRFLMRDLKFAHLALSDLTRKRFYFFQKSSRGAFGEAGFADETRIAWIEDWTLERMGGNVFVLKAAADDVALDLRALPLKQPVVHGRGGISRKADGPGRASHYYSHSRMRVTGEIALTGSREKVEGECWFDHEWASNQLTDEQAGWDWFSLQFKDGTELMLYQLRLKNGGVDPNSSGTFVTSDGEAMHIEDYELVPLQYWTSRKTGARYPIKWRLEVPRLSLQATIETPLLDQELALGPISYWEGAVTAAGRREGREIFGRGYMELTGYNKTFRGLAGRPAELGNTK